MQRSMPYDDRDKDTGKFNPTFTESDFIEAIKSIDIASTHDVKDEVGCAYRTSYERLKSLEEDGRIESQDIGHTLVWSVAETENDEE